MRTMISKWMNNSIATPPSWWLLVKALKSIEQNGIVRKIRSSHGKSKDRSTNCRPSRFINASNSFTHIQVTYLISKRSFLNSSIQIKIQMMTSSSPLQELLAIVGLTLPQYSPSLQQKQKRLKQRRRSRDLKSSKLYLCSESGL